MILEAYYLVFGVLYLEVIPILLLSVSTHQAEGEGVWHDISFEDTHVILC